MNGIYNVVLGDSGKALPSPLQVPLWLGVAMDGMHMSPLTIVCAAPYALGIANQTVTTAKIVDLAVTMAQLLNDFVGHVNIGLSGGGQEIFGKRRERYHCSGKRHQYADHENGERRSCCND